LAARAPGQAEIILEAREAVGPGLTDAGTRGVTLADAALVGTVAAHGARRGRVVWMLAVSTPVADIGRAWVPVVGTTIPARLEATRRGAAVAVEDVPIVAFFAGVEDAVSAATADERPARGNRAHAVEGAPEARAVRGNAAVDRQARTEGLGVAARCERPRRSVDYTRERHGSDEVTGAGDGQGHTGQRELHQACDRRRRPGGGLRSDTPLAADVSRAEDRRSYAEEKRELQD